MKNLANYIDNEIKSLTKFLISENIKYDYFDELVLNHCYIHYDFNYRMSSEYTIYESDGAFPEEHLMVKKIMNEIESNYKDTVIIEFDNKIVDKLYLHFKSNNKNDIEGSYVIDNEKYDDYNLIRWDNGNKKFIFAEINIYNYDKDNKGIEEILYHELNHLWEDYISLTKKNKFLIDHVKQTLNFKYRNNDNIDDVVKDIIYYGENFEISSYVAQLNGLFGSKKYIDIKDAFDKIIKNSSIYQNYKYLYWLINDEDELTKIKNQLSNKEIRYFRKNIDNAWKKIINHSYIICGKHLSENRLSKSNRRKI